MEEGRAGRSGGVEQNRGAPQRSVRTPATALALPRVLSNKLRL